MKTLLILLKASYLSLGFIYLYLIILLVLFSVFLALFNIISKRKIRLDTRLTCGCSNTLLYELIAKDPDFIFLFESNKIKISEIFSYKRTKKRLDQVEDFISDIQEEEDILFKLKHRGYSIDNLIELKVKFNELLENSNHASIKLNPSQISIITDSTNIVSRVDSCEEKDYEEVYIKMLYLSVKVKHFDMFI